MKKLTLGLVLSSALVFYPVAGMAEGYGYGYHNVYHHYDNRYNSNHHGIYNHNGEMHRQYMSGRSDYMSRNQRGFCPGRGAGFYYD